MNQQSIAYLSDGKLFISKSGGPFQMVNSAFVDQTKNRLLEIQQKREWKTKGEGARFMGVQPALGGLDPVSMQARFTGMTHMPASEEIRYSLVTETVGGLFDYNPAENSERRLMHKEYFNIKDISFSRDSGKTVCALSHPGGTSNIGLISESCTDVMQLTEGDSFDEAPRWIPGSKNEIVFHSAGVARDSSGYFAGTGHFSILKLNLSTGSIDTIVEDPLYDYLAPQYTSHGELFCIRRKYEQVWNKRPSMIAILKDIVLFPYKLIKAILSFLNTFSQVFSREPLITAGGTGKKGPDPKMVYLHGRMINIEKEMKRANKNDVERGYVPSDWELVRINASGTECCARGVASFDVCDDDLVYTNGSSIYRLSRDGSKQRMAKGQYIEKIMVY
jgi:hypothetical protein